MFNFVQKTLKLYETYVELWKYVVHISNNNDRLV